MDQLNDSHHYEKYYEHSQLGPLRVQLESSLGNAPHRQRRVVVGPLRIH